jgi:hypothetical protein
MKHSICHTDFIKYTHPSLFAGSWFVVSKIGGSPQRLKICHSDPSVDSIIRIVGTLQQVFKPDCSVQGI